MSLKLFPGACGILLFCILYFIYSCFFLFVCDFYPCFFIPYHDIAEILPEYWRSPSIHRYTFHTSLFLLFCLLSNTFQYVFDNRQIKFSKNLFYKYPFMRRMWNNYWTFLNCQNKVLKYDVDKFIIFMIFFK